MIDRDAAEGIDRIEDAYVNWYLLGDAGRYTLVDAGLPASWRSLQRALAGRGARLDEIEALVLTHAHYDHVGFAERLRRDHGVPVWVPAGDEELSRHPKRFDFERNPLLYVWRPAAAVIVGAMTAAGAPLVGGLDGPVRVFGAGETLDVPGSPRAIDTAGHTHGHISLHLPERDAVIAGDAIVTLDPYTGRRGPRLVARAATANVPRAIASLERIADTGARIVLPGHGDPWYRGAGEAAERAAQAGAA
ncbi:MAG TPA: MBL fold metallo-hydrolase [Solirubrobacteraceae bacterium]|nr:MBL fold metallo-hydrolase [Solirubrobacteraceae bacterium]